MRVASLTMVNATIIEQSKRFPGLLRFAPTPEVSVKHRGLIYTNQLLGSAVEVLGSVQLLWAHGHFLCAGHCIRLLHEILGALRHFQQKVLARAGRSEEDARAADEKLQRLMLATNSEVLLPAGIKEHYKVVSVQSLIDAGEAKRTGFQETYDFLCDISHPTFMHLTLYQLQWDPSWSNELSVAEIHRTLERLASVLEEDIREIGEAVFEIYDGCVPAIEEAVEADRRASKER